MYADAGEGESTTDLVFAGHHLIAENGAVLAESPPFDDAMAVAEIDVQRLEKERQRMTTYPACQREGYEVVPFSMPMAHAEISRPISPHPFVPDGAADRAARCRYILNIQAHGLKKRLAHTGAKTAVVGISGGLDSCLALLAAAHAMDFLGRPRTGYFGGDDAVLWYDAAHQIQCRGAVQRAGRDIPHRGDCAHRAKPF